MTADAIIDRSKLMLGYIGQASRDKIEDMVRMVNDGIQDLIARRSYILFQADGTFATYTEITSANYDSLELPFDEQYREAMAHYVASRILEQDSGDEHNMEQSVYHREMYVNLT